VAKKDFACRAANAGKDAQKSGRHKWKHNDEGERKSIKYEANEKTKSLHHDVCIQIKKNHRQ